MTTTDPEWDDGNADLALGLAEYEAACCSGCGTSRKHADDPEAAFTFDDWTCDVCAASTAYDRLLEEQDEAWEKRLPHSNGEPSFPSPLTRRPMDGRHTFIRWLSPDEAARQRATRDGEGG